jgi:hypothetical protein
MAKRKKQNKRWIQSAVKNKGSLRRSLKVKKGQRIPRKKLEAAAKKGGKTGRRARLALTLRKMPKRGRKRKKSTKRKR